ncbi:MAG: alpha/beta hydrolase [Clostridia bacterium]|nr:alpha/beta hydrolase [Clostridia bacterium]
MRTFIKEQEFSQTLKSTVLPYLAARAKVETCTARDGSTLYTVTYQADAPRGTVVIVHGFSECTDKYSEWIYYLLREGLSVLVFDQRGHGRSHRETAANIIHVDRFERYVEDLEDVLAARRGDLCAPLYLFAHSMGGGVSLLFLEKHKDVFKKAVFSAPLISLQYRGLARMCATSACRFCTLTGRANKMVFVAKRDYASESFDRSAALSPSRFAYLHELRNRDPLFAGGAPSYAWSLAALKLPKKILKDPALAEVTLPVLLLSADTEHLVSPEAQAAVAKKLPHCTHKTVPGSKHEILFANDEILHPVLDEILDFLQ